MMVVDDANELNHSSGVAGWLNGAAAAAASPSHTLRHLHSRCLINQAAKTQSRGPRDNGSQRSVTDSQRERDISALVYAHTYTRREKLFGWHLIKLRREHGVLRPVASVYACLRGFSCICARPWERESKCRRRRRRKPISSKVDLGFLLLGMGALLAGVFTPNAFPSRQVYLRR